jgi:glycosyltransferase involved in cell wall biosynthesis
MSRVLVFGALAMTLATFRGPLFRALRAQGHEVIAIAGDNDERAAAQLAEWGVSFEPVLLERAGLNPFVDFTTVIRLVRLMRRVKPDVYLGYTAKPVIFGTLAARIAGVPRRFAMTTGLGYAFAEGDEIKRRIVRGIATLLYRVALHFSDRVIFQNEDDRAELIQRGVVRADKTARVNGSGVDLDRFQPAPLPSGATTFVMIARLLRDKGVREYAEAARLVRARFPQAGFVLVGPYDPNPAAIRPDEIQRWVADGSIDYRGELSDVRPAIAESHVYVLPSYREGVPRSVLEAMAMARPVITTDAIGCRETTVDGVNGFLVPPKNAQALADAAIKLIQDPQLVARMAAESEKRARELFDAKAVAAAMLKIMRLDRA